MDTTSMLFNKINAIGYSFPPLLFFDSPSMYQSIQSADITLEIDSCAEYP